MKAALLLATLMAPPNAVEHIATTDDLQADFEKAIPCAQIDGRNVWKGGIAYYIQSYVYDTNGGEHAGDGADAVLPQDNTPETVREFEAACSSTTAAAPSR